jgi:hypothetical protein
MGGFVIVLAAAVSGRKNSAKVNKRKCNEIMMLAGYD